MNDQEEYLYTDYAIQIFSAFSNRDISAIIKMFDTEDGEKRDESFAPGILFGFMVHLEILFAAIAESNDGTPLEAFQEYALHYNSVRDDLKKMALLNPTAVTEIIKNHGGSL
jgi:hypothetical protein